MGKIISSVPGLEKIPDFLSSVKPAILKTNGRRSCVAEPGNDLVIVTLLVCKVFLEFDICFIYGESRCGKSTIDVAPKAFTFQETGYSLRLRNVVGVIQSEPNGLVEIHSCRKDGKEGLM